MLTIETAVDLHAALKRYIDAQHASDRATRARGDLLPGSSRAKVTTANARWANAAEQRDRVQLEAERIMFRIIAEGPTTWRRPSSASGPSRSDRTGSTT